MIQKKVYCVNILCCIITSFLFFSCQSDRQDAAHNPSKVIQTPSNTQKVSNASVPNFNADSAYVYVQKQVEFGPRIPNSEAQRKCAAWLQATLKNYVDTVIIQKTKLRGWDKKQLDCINIIASINPKNNNRVLLASHWDSRSWGDEGKEHTNEPILAANDGASGVGVLLEIARQIKNKPINLGVDFILFDLEDYGISKIEDSYCLGSQYWGTHLHVPNYDARFGILLDMVGAKGATFPREGYSMNFASSVVQKVWGTAQDLGYGANFVDRNIGPITDDHFYINSLTQIPTIDIIHYEEDGFFEHWHTNKDNLDVIDKNTLKAVGQTVITVIYNENLTLIQ